MPLRSSWSWSVPTLLMVSRVMGASPLNMLSMLAPPSASSPLPVDRRRSISSASLPWLETISRRCSFSYQRKAGMPSLLPSSRPAWLADVCEGSMAVHPGAGASRSAPSATASAGCRRAAGPPGGAGPARRSGRRPRPARRWSARVVPHHLRHHARGEAVLVAHADQPAQEGQHGGVDAGRDDRDQEAIDRDPHPRQDDEEEGDPEEQPDERHRDQADRQRQRHQQGRRATSSSAMIVTATSTPASSISTRRQPDGDQQRQPGDHDPGHGSQQQPGGAGRRRPTVRNWARYSLPSRRRNSIDYTSTRSPGAAITTRVASPVALASAARRCGGSASRLRRQRIPIGHSVPQWIGTVTRGPAPRRRRRAPGPCGPVRAGPSPRPAAARRPGLPDRLHLVEQVGVAGEVDAAPSASIR